MLVLTRKLDESIQIGDDIKITVLRVKGNAVRIGIEAPKSVRVVRDELEREVVGGSRLAAASSRPTNRIEAFVKEASNVVTSVVDSPADGETTCESRLFVGKLDTVTGRAELSESNDSDQAAPLRAFLKTDRSLQIAG